MAPQNCSTFDSISRRCLGIFMSSLPNFVLLVCFVVNRLSASALDRYSCKPALRSFGAITCWQ
jgi:hypothetical protein